RQAVTRFDRRFRTTHHLIANRHTFGRNNVATRTIRVQQQSDICSAVWIVFNTLNFGWNAILVALEIDNAIVLLVTTTDMTGGNVTVVVTTGAFRFLFEQARKRTAFVQVVINDLDHAATTRRGRLDFNE